MATVTWVSGSSPAYVYLFIEAMADAAVADGMSRKEAYLFAAQAVLGAAKMVLETGKHPGELKDMVCSPGGTTIDAVAILEKEGLRNAVISAQRACTEKAKNPVKQILFLLRQWLRRQWQQIDELRELSCRSPFNLIII